MLYTTKIMSNTLCTKELDRLINNSDTDDDIVRIRVNLVRLRRQRRRSQPVEDRSGSDIDSTVSFSSLYNLSVVIWII